MPMRQKWSRHTSTFDEDSVRFLSIVQHFLVEYFGHSDTTAEQAMDEFMAEMSWDEDMYHHEGAYRVAAMIYYIRDLRGNKLRWIEWLQESGHNAQPEGARRYFWNHYLKSSTDDGEHR